MTASSSKVVVDLSACSQSLACPYVTVDLEFTLSETSHSTGAAFCIMDLRKKKSNVQLEIMISVSLGLI